MSCNAIVRPFSFTRHVSVWAPGLRLTARTVTSLGAKSGFYFIHFFKQFTFHSVCNEWAELHTLSVQLKCVLHLIPVHPGEVFTYPGKTSPAAGIKEKSGSRHQSPLPSGNNEYGTVQSNRCETLLLEYPRRLLLRSLTGRLTHFQLI